MIEVKPPLTQLQSMGPGDQVAVFICVQKDGKPLVFKLADSELLAMCVFEQSPEDGNMIREKHSVRLTYDQMLRAAYFEQEGGIIFVVRKDPSPP